MACDWIGIIQLFFSIGAAVPAIMSIASTRWVFKGELELGIWHDGYMNSPTEIQWVQKMMVIGQIGTAGALLCALGALALINHKKYRLKCIYNGSGCGLFGGGCYMVAFSIFTYFMNTYEVNLEYGTGYIMCIVAWLMHWVVFFVFICPQCKEDDDEEEEENNVNN